MTKFGQVKAYNEQTGVATVAFERPEACAKCGGCGLKSQTGIIELKADCQPGDWVRVELPEGRFLQATAMAYVIPLFGLLAGLGLGGWLGGGSDLGALLGGGLGLGIALLLLRLTERRIAGKAEWTPHISEVFASKPSIEDIGCQAKR